MAPPCYLHRLMPLKLSLHEYLSASAALLYSKIEESNLCCTVHGRGCLRGDRQELALSADCWPPCGRFSDGRGRCDVAHDGRAADVWALGVLLYNLLERGESPFGPAARDEAELRAQICSGHPPRLPAHLSAGCCDLLGGLLERDPARRIRAADVRGHPWAAAAAAATTEPSAQPLVERVAALQVGRPAAPVMKCGGGAGLAGRSSALGPQR